MEFNKNIEQISAETQKLFSGAKVEWAKSKELIWEERLKKITGQPEGKRIQFSHRLSKMSIAASFILLIGFGGYAWFYSETFESPAGAHLSTSLPDGSTVEMNAVSSLKFYPHRWPLVKEVKFEGEGFFTIQKGKKFTVKSKHGETSVLGTSFNIFSRDVTYRVFCVTGKVNVRAGSGESVILNPNQQVIIKPGDLLKPEKIILPENILSWRNNQFIFTAAPFNEVVKEIERQYNITINTSGDINGIISCSFQKESDVEKTLSTVCKPLGYKYNKISERNYLIRGNN